MNTITKAYLTAALWSSITYDGEALDANYSIEDFAPEALARAEADVTLFLEAVKARGLDVSGLEDDSIGHDLWLTRNRYGSGFWDRGLGALGTALTEIAHGLGGVDCYVGDVGEADGLVFFI
jgi:hypothetical protein